MIAPNRLNRSQTQDGRALRRSKRRWTVERTIAWLQNYRRLCIRWEKSHLAFQAFFTWPALSCSSKRFGIASSPTGLMESCFLLDRLLRDSLRSFGLPGPRPPPSMPQHARKQRHRFENLQQTSLRPNVAGGNRGLAQALAELQHAYRPVYITHELNRVSEPLLRTQQIDYLIVHDLDEMVVAPLSSCARSPAMIVGPTPSSIFLSA